MLWCGKKLVWEVLHPYQIAHYPDCKVATSGPTKAIWIPDCMLYKHVSQYLGIISAHKVGSPSFNLVHIAVHVKLTLFINILILDTRMIPKFNCNNKLFQL